MTVDWYLPERSIGSGYVYWASKRLLNGTLVYPGATATISKS
jgi:hypothetical protein